MKLLSSALVVVSLMCACGEDVTETVLVKALSSLFVYEERSFHESYFITYVVGEQNIRINPIEH